MNGLRAIRDVRTVYKEAFDEAHRRSLDALRRRDLSAQREAVLQEREIIAEQCEFIKTLKTLLLADRKPD